MLQCMIRSQRWESDLHCSGLSLMILILGPGATCPPTEDVSSDLDHYSANPTRTDPIIIDPDRALAPWADVMGLSELSEIGFAL